MSVRARTADDESGRRRVDLVVERSPGDPTASRRGVAIARREGPPPADEISRDEIVVHIALTLGVIEIRAEVTSPTAETVRLSIDPNTSWDADALRSLSMELHTVAGALLTKRDRRTETRGDWRRRRAP